MDISAWCECSGLWFWIEFSAEVCSLLCTQENGWWYLRWNTYLNEWCRTWCNGHVSFNNGLSCFASSSTFRRWYFMLYDNNLQKLEQVGMLFVRCHGGVSQFTKHNSIIHVRSLVISISKNKKLVFMASTLGVIWSTNLAVIYWFFCQ